METLAGVERPLMRAGLIGAAFAAAHFVLTLGLLMFSVGATMGRFDAGGPATTGERIADALLEIVTFPLVQALDRWAPGHWFGGLSGYIPFAANSVLWGGLVALALARLVRGHAARARRGAQG